jgi:hypothetical protein
MGQVPLGHEENVINQEASRINKIENRTCMLLMDIWFFLGFQSDVNF